MNLTKADYETDLELLSPEKHQALTDLIRGVAAMLFSSVLGTFFSMLIIMSPDPDGKIRYGWACMILAVLLVVFIYGVWRLDTVQRFLKKGN